VDRRCLRGMEILVEPGLLWLKMSKLGKAPKRMREAWMPNSCPRGARA